MALQLMARNRFFKGMCGAAMGGYLPDAIYMWRLNSILKSRENLSEKRLQDLQDSLIRKQIQYVYENSLFYKKKFRKAQITPDHIRGYSDLIKIPITTRQEVINHYSEFIIKNAPHGIRKTSGTSGEFLSVRCTKYQYFLNHLLLGRVFERLGARYGDLVMSVHNISSPFKFFTELRSYDVIQFRYEKMNDALKALNDLPITIIFSSPQLLELLSEGYHQTKAKRIKFIVSFAELLSESRRARIEKSFNSKVYNLYGLSELPLIACECKDKKMHINSDVVALEAVHQNKQVFGQSGSVIVTDLFDTWAPLIRYETGDRGALSLNGCTCGCAFSILSNLDGRSNDFIVLGDGTRITPLLLMYAMFKIPDARKYQLVQKANRRVSVHVVCDSRNFDKIQVQIRKELEKILIDFEIEVERVADIPLSGEPGKSKFIISEL